MAIAKQAFYEGAALYLIARSGDLRSIGYEAPFFVLNRRLSVLLKYSTQKRSPWGFTLSTDEQALLSAERAHRKLAVGLICGADGVAAVPYDALLTIASPKSSALRISCYRRHREQYEIKGPDGVLDRKVPPSAWPTILRP